MSGPTVFLVRSSLQFMLALSLAEERRANALGASRVLFLPDVLEPGLFERAAAAVPDPPFDRLVVVRPRRLPGQAATSRRWAGIRRDLVDALADARPGEVVVFNDREDAGQAVLIAAARDHPAAVRTCVEDGAHAYRDFLYPRPGAFTRWRQRWRHGRAWAEVRVLGTHPLVQRYLAIHPQLLRRELRCEGVQPFPAQQLGSAPLRAFAAAFCGLVGFDPATLPPRAVLLSASSSTYAARNPDYAAMMRAAVARLRDDAAAVLFKYHPREPQADYLDLASLPGAREIPRALPLECLYVLARERPLLVVGGLSTSVMMAALLMPQARGAALVHASGVGDRWDDALFSALRISAVRAADDLVPLLRAWREGAPA